MIICLVVVGRSWGANPLYVVQDLGSLSDNQNTSQAYAINESGQVVGAGPGGGGDAWIWDAGNGMQSLGSFPGGDGNNRAIAINDQGVVVGFAELIPGIFNQAFRWTPSTGMQPLAGIGSGSQAWGINNRGAIVGGTGTSGFLWQAGMVTMIGGLPGSEASILYGINNKNEAVGRSDSPSIGFLLQAGTIVSLGRIRDGSQLAINDRTEVVGVSMDNEAFKWDATQGMQGLGVLSPICLQGEEHPQSNAFGINNQGQVVGHSCVSNGQHAFLWDSTNGMRDLNNLVSLPAGDVLTIAYGINNDGQIVGAGTLNGHLHAFRLVPVFAGTPGYSNCYGKSVSALTQQYGGLNNAASALGYSSAKALQNTILAFCEG
jgi:probable HAF family extracellular repeat protein